MAVTKRLLIVLAVVAAPLMLAMLFTFDIIKIDWISMMEIQPSFRSQEEPLPLPPNSIPIDGAAWIPELGAPANPIPADEASLERGQRYYTNTCAVCHGADGKATTVVSAFLVQKRPPSLLEGNAVANTDGALFLTITNGIGYMPSLKENLPKAEMRWDVINYLRSLQ